jgi:hypothetical protein
LRKWEEEVVTHFKGELVVTREIESDFVGGISWHQTGMKKNVLPLVAFRRPVNIIGRNRICRALRLTLNFARIRSAALVK